MKKRIAGLISSLMLLPAAVQATLPQGAGHYAFEHPATRAMVPVDYYKPAGYTGETPVVVVLHGVKRDALAYRDAWKRYADQHNLLILVPTFTRQTYPGANGYNLGNVFHATTKAELTGKILPAQANPEALWSFALPDAVFDDFKTREQTEQTGYTLYGHGAGAQFANRFALFMQDSLACRIIAANPGWYTYPDHSATWPYGIAGVTMIDDAQINRYLTAPLVLMLGSDDVKASGGVMRNTLQAKAQGANRHIRGATFIEYAKQLAAARDIALAWQFDYVAGAGHSDEAMVPAAVTHITACQS